MQGRTGNAEGVPVDQEHVHIYTKTSEDGTYSSAKFTDPTEFFDTQFEEDGTPIEPVPKAVPSPPFESSLEGNPEIE